MKLKMFKKRWHNIAAVCFASLIVVILVGAIFVNNYWSPILASEVKKTVLKSSDSLYTCNFSSAELHVLRGTIDIYNITLRPDTTVYNLRKKQNLAPNNLVELHIKRLTLSHIHPFKLYFLKKLDIGTIAVDQPVLNVSYQLNHKKDTSLSNTKTVWQKISKSLHSVHIGDILLGDVKFKYEDYSGHKLAISELREMNLSAHDLLIDSTTQNDKSRRLFCKEIVAELNNYTMKSPDGLYTFHFDHLMLSTLTSRLNIEGISLKPIEAAKFFEKSDNDKFSLRLDSLELDSFDFINYHKYRIISASALRLKTGRLEVFNSPNKSKNQQNADKAQSFPNAALFKLNMNIKIDTVNAKHIDILYTEYNHDSHRNGTVGFYNTGGTFLNVTTRPEALAKNNICSVNLHTLLMNAGKLDVQLTFNLTDENHSYSYSGTLGGMSLKALNPATMPLTRLKIQSGDLKRFTFSFKADRTQAKGKVLFLYNDVKVTLLKYDSLFNSLQSKPVESLFANNFILKHNNPDNPGSTPREVYLTHGRTTETPFFRYTWQTLLEGIKPSIGLDKGTQQRTVAMLNQLSEDKQERLVKRQQRRERRAQRRLKKAQQSSDNTN